MQKIAAALSKAQAQMGHAEKDCVNPHFRSRYASLASCWNAIRAPLTEHGLAVAQMIDAVDGGGVVLRTVVMHESGEMIESRYPVVPAGSPTPQAWGSAITYARRYALCAAVGLVADDDDDGNQASQGSMPEVKPSSSVDDIKRLRSELRSALDDARCPERVRANAAVKAAMVGDVTVVEIRRVIAKVRASYGVVKREPGQEG